MLENIETCYNQCYNNNNKKKTLDHVPEKKYIWGNLKSLSEVS